MDRSLSSNHQSLNTRTWLSKLQRILQTKGISAFFVPCYAYFRRNRRHFYMAIFILCFILFSPLTVITTKKKIQQLLPRGDLPEYKQWQDSLTSLNNLNSMQDVPHTYSVTSTSTQCDITKPNNTPKPIQPGEYCLQV